ncbi:hypothetical protein ABH931_004105 [Streptacidiphilus sp. MAP12-33]
MAVDGQGTAGLIAGVEDGPSIGDRSWSIDVQR